MKENFIKAKAIINKKEVEVLIPYSEVEKYFEARNKQSSESIAQKINADSPEVRKAVKFILKTKKFSTSMLQVYLNKGHRFVSALAVWFEQIGIIGPINGNFPREVLISSIEEFDKKARNH